MGHWDDQLEIRDVIDRYAAALDTRHWETVRSCFTADCRVDYEHFGSWTAREPFVEWLEVIHRPVRRTLHRIANHQIVVHRDRANATSYLDALLQMDDEGQGLLNVVGRYVDELARNDDEWRISDRRFETFLRRKDRLSGS